MKKSIGGNCGKENKSGGHNTRDSHRTRGARVGHSVEILNNVIAYLQKHPVKYYDQVDSLLELIYQAYTEFNSVETPEFRELINPLDRRLRSLVDTDEEADEYMNLVFAIVKLQIIFARKGAIAAN